MWEEYMNDLEEHIYNLNPNKEKKPNTQIEPFNLTQPQPRKFYLPEAIVVPEKKPRQLKSKTDAKLDSESTASMSMTNLRKIKTQTQVNTFS